MQSLGLIAQFCVMLPLLAEATSTGFTVHLISQARPTGVNGLTESLVMGVNKNMLSSVRLGVPGVINHLLISDIVC